VPDKIWTAAELERLSPAERRQIVEESLVTDPGQISPDLLERARADFRRLNPEYDPPATG
jgi:hypothetical protein